MAERGEIKNREYRTQINDFSKLRFGKITPTDIDAFLDFGNRLFVFVECKYGESKMPYGQQLAFERIVDACHVFSKRLSVGFVVQHWSQGDIDYAGTIVQKYRYQGKWREPANPQSTLLEGINAFIKLHESINPVDKFRVVK